MAIPGGFIDELVARSDIHSIVSTYVQLKKSGSGYVGLCPFHNEKTPSFHVDGDKQLFYCFGCGTGGGVISFVMKIEHLEFVEAVEYLAKRAGMEVPADREDAVLRQSRKRYIEMHRLAARFYYSMLLTPKGKLALEYFIRRGFDVKTIKQFGLGFAPDSWSELTAELKSKGFSEDELVEAGLSIKNPKGNVYDRFRNRVMFPIIDVKGDVIAFGGRVMDNSVPKYLNSPETRTFNKRHNLFALNIAKKSGSGNIILVEGYMDVIALHQAGFDIAVASLGTSLTAEQARLIKRYADTVYIAYDGDGAGIAATERAISILRDADLKINVVSLRDTKDPDEFIKKYGAEEFRLIMESAQSDSEFLIGIEKDKFDTSTDDGKTSYLKNAAVQIARLESPIERDVYISRVASEAGVSKEALQGQVELERKRTYRKLRNAERRKIMRPDMNAQPVASDLRYRDISKGIAMERTVVLMSIHPELMETADELELDERDFDSDYLRRAYALIRRRHDEGLSTAIASLSGELGENEISQLTRAMNSMDLSYSETAIGDYVKIIKKPKHEDMSDEEYLEDILMRKKQTEV